MHELTCPHCRRKATLPPKPETSNRLLLRSQQRINRRATKKLIRKRDQLICTLHNAEKWSAEHIAVVVNMTARGVYLVLCKAELARKEAKCKAELASKETK